MPLEENVLFQSSQASERTEKEKKRIKERSAKLSGQQDEPINQKKEIYFRADDVYKDQI